MFIQVLTGIGLAIPALSYIASLTKRSRLMARLGRELDLATKAPEGVMRFEVLKLAVRTTVELQMLNEPPGEADKDKKTARQILGLGIFGVLVFLAVSVLAYDNAVRRAFPEEWIYGVRWALLVVGYINIVVASTMAWGVRRRRKRREATQSAAAEHSADSQTATP